jgi:ubiquinone/menaquinone biosynthesis C-methylase UbiE
MRLRPTSYVLGHTDREQSRLMQQARFLASATRHFFADAGIAAGMRVLDIGCGMGDVTMIVAELVGPTGKVVAIDFDQASVDTARGRISALGFENATFHQADLTAFRDPDPFDAIVGRLVLEFVPDPIAVVCHLSELLRPGGIMALQEPSWRIWLAHTSHLPLRTAVTTLLRDTFRAGGADTEMELPLFRAFLAADLTSPQLRLEVPVGNSPEFRRLLHDLLLALWSRAEAHQLPLGALGDPKTLASRLEEELNANGAFASFVALVGAFARRKVR